MTYVLQLHRLSMKGGTRDLMGAGAGSQRPEVVQSPIFSYILQLGQHLHLRPRERKLWPSSGAAIRAGLTSWALPPTDIERSMTNPRRVLFVSGEVSPFAKVSDLADLVRQLPEKMQESGEFEVRIMMPRYGTISERRNRLHEVIRLSGTEVQMGGQKETLKVKVASIPGIRLQVYFMDNKTYFKRKGVFSDKTGTKFDDNAERALFFGRASIETIKNLGWEPDIVHAFGTMSGLVPMLLRTEYASDPLFDDVKTVFTPCKSEVEAVFSSEEAAHFGVPTAEEAADMHVTELGIAYADLIAFPAGQQNGVADATEFPLSGDDLLDFARGMYEQVSNGVPA